MEYRHSFLVHRDAAAVRAFHEDPEALAAITPPPVRVTCLTAPGRPAAGDELAFVLQVGPLRVPWRARIETVDETGFTDRQIEGPFREWAHRHEFVALDDATTLVRDTVTFHICTRPRRALLGVAMAVGLPLLFRYRARRTRRLLEGMRG